MAFKFVKRSLLPSTNRFNGKMAGQPHVRLHKGGTLYFSKMAGEVFASRERAVIEYDEDAQTLKFTAVDKPPRGLAEDDCFLITRHNYKGAAVNSCIAVKRLLRYLGFEYAQPIDFPVSAMNLETHSIELVIPALGLVEELARGREESDQAEHNHVEAPAAVVR